MQYTTAMGSAAKKRYVEIAHELLGKDAKTAGYSEEHWIVPKAILRHWVKENKLSTAPRPGYLVYMAIPGVRSAWVAHRFGQYELTINGLLP